MTLVVGFTPHKGDRSPIQLGATLARSAGQDLRVVTVIAVAMAHSGRRRHRPGVRALRRGSTARRRSPRPRPRPPSSAPT